MSPIIARASLKAPPRSSPRNPFNAVKLSLPFLFRRSSHVYHPSLPPSPPPRPPLLLLQLFLPSPGRSTRRRGRKGCSLIELLFFPRILRAFSIHLQILHYPFLPLFLFLTSAPPAPERLNGSFCFCFFCFMYGLLKNFTLTFMLGNLRSAASGRATF